MPKHTTLSTHTHTPSGRWKLGLLLSVVTVVLWSTVPIALVFLLDTMDAVTITWYRFLVGGTSLGMILACCGALPSFGKAMQGANRVWLAVAALGMTGNFALYLYGLNYIPPGSSQVVMQVAPLLVMAGSVAIFRERIRVGQMAGVFCLTTGFGFFFNQRFAEFGGNVSGYAVGTVIVFAAAVLWAAYALAQKQLLTIWSSPGILFVLYSAGVMLLFPFCQLGQIRGLSLNQFFILGYACGNNLVAYFCFSEAMRHWEASRVAAVVTITPLLTLVLAHGASLIWPAAVAAEQLNGWGVLGAIVVVVGSMTTALAGRKLL